MVIKNVKIKNFMIVSFVMILCLMLIVGGTSLYFTRKLADQTIKFNDGPHTVQVEVAEIQRIMADIGSQIKEAITYKTPEKTQETTAFINQSLAEMNNRITLVKDRYTGDLKLIQNADSEVALWLKSIDDLRVAMESKKYDEAMSIFESDYITYESAMIKASNAIGEYSKTITEEFKRDAVNSKNTVRAIIFILIIIAVIYTFAICALIIKSILVPLERIKNASNAMAKGNLHYHLDFAGTNEFGQLAASMTETTGELYRYVQNIDHVLGSMADNDLNVAVDMEYRGDFKSIQLSLEKIIKSFNKAIKQIDRSSDQVAAGAAQVSSSSQVLSQGTAEQAGSIEELSANITDITEQVKKNAVYTFDTNTLVEEVGHKLEQGNQQMSQMLSAISEINNASDQIAKIIKAIEDIAFQTNILALNAAVEAARAGSAGKGFAVVADEVRNLAGKSAEAAQSTTALIQNSIEAVRNGTKIANETAGTLETVVTGSQEIMIMVSKITKSSDEQSKSLSQVMEGIQQISQVIQTNSATSQECAASSEELSSQAQIMQNLVDKFQLINNK